MGRDTATKPSPTTHCVDLLPRHSGQLFCGHEVRISSGASPAILHCRLQLCMATSAPFPNHHCHGPSNHCRIVRETLPLPLPSTLVLLSPANDAGCACSTQPRELRFRVAPSHPHNDNERFSNTGTHTLGG
jgi:hypothetical protein